MFNRRWRRVVMAGVATVAAAGVGGSIVFAMSSSSDTQTGPVAGVHFQASPSATASPGTKLGPKIKESLDQYIKDLAKNLGVDEQKLRDAMKQTALDEINRLEAAGSISKDMADKFRNAVNSGDFSFGLPGLAPEKPKNAPGGEHDGLFGVFGLGSFGALDPMGAVDDLAKFLNVDRAGLLSELTSGKSLAEIAQAHGKSRDDLKNFLGDEVKQKLQQGVASGKMTQAQADKAQQQFADNLDRLVDGKIQLHGDRSRGPKPKTTPAPSTAPSAPRYRGGPPVTS